MQHSAMLLLLLVCWPPTRVHEEEVRASCDAAITRTRVHQTFKLVLEIFMEKCIQAHHVIIEVHMAGITVGNADVQQWFADAHVAVGMKELHLQVVRNELA